MTDIQAWSDARCVERARWGDAAAFEVLVRRYFRAAYAVALAVVGNRFDAEDVCQDAFLRAAARLDECRDGAKFAPWLLRIVRNAALNLCDRRRVRAAVPLEAVTAPAAEVADREVEREELRRHLERALSYLTPTQREVVLLHDLEGWTHRQIAAVIGTSEGMSRQHLFVARRVLREHLKSYMLGEWAHE
jgi:RNA polymerase sigma-70 factor (ECF subfamily)